MSRATVLIADDHPIVREGLISVLRDKFEVVGLVGDGTTLIDEASRLHPDVIVTDISMPGLNGIEVIRRLKVKRTNAKIIVLTMHAGAELATEAMRAGAAGFVLKQSVGEELVAAINEALQGRVYLSPAVTADVVARLSDTHGRQEPHITVRQREVLRLITEGRRMKEIAQILNLSTRTVETHKYEMMQALGVQSTAELIRYAVQHRLIQDV
jgi:DNA-binding NarL/FixJ family response regulator